MSGCNKCFSNLGSSCKVICVDCKCEFHKGCFQPEPSDILCSRCDSNKGHFCSGTIWRRCKPCDQILLKNMRLESDATERKLIIEKPLKNLTDFTENQKETEKNFSSLLRMMYNKMEESTSAVKVIEDLLRELMTLRERIEKIETRLEDEKYCSRTDTVEVHGTPQSKNEDVLAVEKEGKASSCETDSKTKKAINFSRGGLSKEKQPPPVDVAELESNEVLENGEGKPKEIETNTDLSLEEETITIEPISIKVLRAEGNGIVVSDISLAQQTSLINSSHTKVVGLDYHYNRKYIFFSAIDKIFRSDVVGRLQPTDMPKPILSTGVDGVVMIAVDWIHDNIYWMSEKQQAIEMADLNGQNRTLLFDNFKNTKYPNNIAVDPYKGYLFFVSNHSVYRSSLMGENLIKVQLMNQTERGVRCIALDIQKERLYYTGKVKDFLEGKVYFASSNYEGQAVENHQLKGKWNDIFSFGVFRDKLYFGHFDPKLNDSLWTADLLKSPIDPVQWSVGAEAPTGMWSIRVHHPGVQRPGITKKVDRS